MAALDPHARIFVAGHRGMVGSAIVRRLEGLGCRWIITRGREDLDLRDPLAVREFFAEQPVDHVVLAAAKVGGIHANRTYPAQFIHDNLAIVTTVIHAAHEAGIERLLFLGSSCIYPREADQPMREEALLTGPLESTNEPYAIAKIAGIKLCESYNRQFGRDYRSVMPTNLYGPNDNFDPDTSHVIAALIRRFHEAVRDGADEVVIWGSGTPRREFLHVDDLAAACVHVMALEADAWRSQTESMRAHLNVGTGSDVTIHELAEMIARISGFNGRLRFDVRMPDGAPRKRLDVTRMRELGWTATIPLEDGLRQVWQWYREHAALNPIFPK